MPLFNERESVCLRLEVGFFLQDFVSLSASEHPSLIARMDAAARFHAESRLVDRSVSTRATMVSRAKNAAPRMSKVDLMSLKPCSVSA